jgi:hypothetical protein
MQITMYLRTYPVAGAPIAVSFAPDAAAQRHTFTAAGREYEAEHQEVRVFVPDDAKLDLLKKFLGWTSDKGPFKSTAREVYDLAKARSSGFRLLR